MGDNPLHLTMGEKKAATTKVDVTIQDCPEADRRARFLELDIAHRAVDVRLGTKSGHSDRG